MLEQGSIDQVSVPSVPVYRSINITNWLWDRQKKGDPVGVALFR